jgi:hypothetical protein
MLWGRIPIGFEETTDRLLSTSEGASPLICSELQFGFFTVKDDEG